MIVCIDRATTTTTHEELFRLFLISKIYNFLWVLIGENTTGPTRIWIGLGNVSAKWTYDATVLGHPVMREQSKGVQELLIQNNIIHYLLTVGDRSTYREYASAPSISTNFPPNFFFTQYYYLHPQFHFSNLYPLIFTLHILYPKFQILINNFQYTAES